MHKYYKNYKIFLKKEIKKNFNYKPLIKKKLKKKSGRNNKGRITVYQRGGCVKRLYRKICFNYVEIQKYNLNKWLVEKIEYDPNRSCHIALLKNEIDLYLNKKIVKILKKYKNFFKYFYNIFYIYKLANKDLKKGDIISFFDKNEQYFPLKGQYLKIYNIKTGSFIFNLEILPLTYGSAIRAAGTKGKLLRKYNKYGLIRLPSKKRKLYLLSCFTTLGEASNNLLFLKKNYKAGNSRWKGKKPHVRGVAKNPVDHPHGGGEGKSSGGRPSTSRWGWLTKGYILRKKKKKKEKKHV